jgi:hypothetical protein
MGFSRRWTNWLSTLLSSESSRILLNGNQGQRIFHAWELWQGDPLSPFLFVLAMEALNTLFWLADSRGVLTSLRAPAIRYHLSLCTDDLVIFIMPSDRDLCLCCKHLLKHLGSVPTSPKACSRLSSAPMNSFSWCSSVYHANLSIFPSSTWVSRCLPSS